MSFPSFRKRHDARLTEVREIAAGACPAQREALRLGDLWEGENAINVEPSGQSVGISQSQKRQGPHELSVLPQPCPESCPIPTLHFTHPAVPSALSPTQSHSILQTLSEVGRSGTVISDSQRRSWVAIPGCCTVRGAGGAVWTLDLVAGASSSCQWLFSQGHAEDRDAGQWPPS